MTGAYPRLDAALEDAGVDGYLVDADGDDPTQYYLSGYHAPDEFVTLYADGEVRLLVSPLEATRADGDSDAAEVRDLAEFDFEELAEEHGRNGYRPHAAARFLDEYGIDSVAVPVSFPSGTAEVLREYGVDVEVDYDDAVGDLRAVKTDAEIEAVAETQRANEAAMAAAEDLLAAASVEDGVLVHDGDALTSERVRREIEVTLLEEGCLLEDCIVASGPEAARAHESGSGPIEAGEPVVVDVFPRGKTSRYYGDMTRTFVKGEHDDQTREWYEVIRAAFDAALDVLEAGVTGEAVDAAVCDVFEDAGYPTLRTHDSPDRGFFHSTGHGVGLAVHEQPSLSRFGGELEAGHVVTVEPGLYEQGVGGVRLEDLVVVTEDGYRNLDDYPRDLRVV
ncbi:MAG: M24 family metallopeptidase [Halobacterium sp.]